MKFLSLVASAAAVPLAVFAQAADLSVSDAYVRSSNPQSGAAFMTISNAGATDCTLTGVSGDAAERMELHTHQEADGVMKMVRDEDGFTVPAGGSHALARGGDHVMLLGLAAPLADGGTVTLVLDFGPCGTLPVEAPVDNARVPGPPEMPMNGGAHAGHGTPQN